MKINPMSFFVASNINKTNNHSALKNNDINDSFVSTTSFAGKRKFMTDRDLKYSSAHVKSPWNYLNIDLKTGRIDNFWARKMTEGKLTAEIGKRAKVLEELGMNHEDACEFVSEVMNLGIAMQEKWNKTHKNNSK